MDLPDTGDLVYVTTATAARLLGVRPCTISVWKSRGHLTPVPGSPPRRPLYLWADVVEAEYTARMNAVRTSGSATQCQRGGHIN